MFKVIVETLCQHIIGEIANNKLNKYLLDFYLILC